MALHSGLLLEGLGGEAFVVVGIKPELTLCMENILSIVLSLWTQAIYFKLMLSESL